MAQPYRKLIEWQAYCDGRLFPEVLKRILDVHSPYYTQEQLARVAGYHKTWLSHILNGSRPVRHNHVSNLGEAIPCLLYESLYINRDLHVSVTGLSQISSFNDDIEKIASQLILEIYNLVEKKETKTLQVGPAARHVKQLLYVSFVCNFLESNGLGEL